MYCAWKSTVIFSWKLTTGPHSCIWEEDKYNCDAPGKGRSCEAAGASLRRGPGRGLIASPQQLPNPPGASNSLAPALSVSTGKQVMLFCTADRWCVYGGESWSVRDDKCVSRYSRNGFSYYQWVGRTLWPVYDRRQTGCLELLRRSVGHFDSNISVCLWIVQHYKTCVVFSV